MTGDQGMVDIYMGPPAEMTVVVKFVNMIFPVHACTEIRFSRKDDMYI